MHLRSFRSGGTTKFSNLNLNLNLHFVAKRYIQQQKCLNGQIGTCLIEHAGTTFGPVHRP